MRLVLRCLFIATLLLIIIVGSSLTLDRTVILSSFFDFICVALINSCYTKLQRRGDSIQIRSSTFRSYDTCTHTHAHTRLPPALHPLVYRFISKHTLPLGCHSLASVQFSVAVYTHQATITLRNSLSKSLLHQHSFNKRHCAHPCPSSFRVASLPFFLTNIIVARLRSSHQQTAVRLLYLIG